MKHFPIVLLLISISSLYTKAQVSGRLKTSSGKPIPHATVILKNSEGLVLKYSITNENGSFQISLPDSLRKIQLLLEFTHLGFHKLQTRVQPNTNYYEVVMEEDFNTLPEVKITNQPTISSKGDTLSYNVRSFSREDDRNIGDVIRRFPGVEVDEKGRISYNGKPVSNLYIDGDDLMDGRYGLATRTINKELIQSVDIIQQHQPIRVLKDKVSTDDVAMNLVLKNENSLALSGQATAGAGFPKQYDAALNTIILSKKFKMLNSIKMNNSGTDYRDDFLQLGIANFQSESGTTTPDALLSPGTVGAPDLPRNNYYLNRSGLINFNNLVNNKKGIQLKSNIQAFIDRQTLDYSGETQQYLSGDTIVYNETQHSLKKPHELKAAFTVMANKDRYFLNNKLSVNMGAEKIMSGMFSNGTGFNQQLNIRMREYTNDFSYTPALKNEGIMDFSWYSSYSSNPQRLNIDKGLHSEVLNEGIAFKALAQQAETPAFFNRLAVSYRLVKGLVHQYYELGFLDERQKLNSLLQLVQTDGTVSPYKSDAGNALRWQRNRGYINASYALRRERYEASVTVPLNLQRIAYRDPAYTLYEKDNRFFVNPSAQLKWLLNAEDYMTLRYSYTNNFGNISGVYPGLVLTNYRSLTASDADLQEKRNASGSLHYNFQRSIIMLFMHAGAQYSKVTANAVYSSVITNAVQRVVLLPFENDQSRFSFNAGISKYLFILKTTVSARANWQQSNYSQLANNVWLPYKNRILTLVASAETRLLEKISLSYSGITNWARNRQSQATAASKGVVNRLSRIDQNAVLGFMPLTRVFVNLKARHIRSRQPNTSDINYLFTDVHLRYKSIRLRADFEFDLTNISNVSSYELLVVNSNLFSVARYEIRGRMGILRVTFNL
jgi:hypothetical protein